MTIGLWQIPVLVGAGIVVLAYLVPGIAGLRRPAQSRPNPARTAVVRTVSLAVLSVALFGLLVIAVQTAGTSAGTNVAAIASLVLEGAALRWTYLAYRATKELNQAGAQAPVPSPTGSESGHSSDPPG
jgi:hypothetical protein